MENTYKLNEMARSIYLANKEKGFWDKERNVGEMLMLIVTELAEAMEAHRGRGNLLNKAKFIDSIEDVESSGYKLTSEMFKEYFEQDIKDTFEDEISDALIRIFDLCGGLNIDLDFHVINKLKYNATREKLHGKKY
jgi:NTP pyrophosphatase (non-canonical NTP hydrolase)